MHSFVLIGYLAGGFGVVSTLGSMYVVWRGSAGKATYEAQRELISTLIMAKEEQAARITELSNKHDDSVKAISQMQGQIEVLRNIPLKEISKDLAEVAASQKAILEILTSGSARRKR